jgi:hypothetical protein
MNDGDVQQVWKNILTIKYSHLAVTGEPEKAAMGN